MSAPRRSGAEQLLPLSELRPDGAVARLRGRVRYVVVLGCSPGAEMVLSVASDLGSSTDACGVPMDAVWRMMMPGVPDRWMRLWGGTESVQQLLENYSFLDGTGCMYNASPARIIAANAAEVGRRLPRAVRALAGLRERGAWVGVHPNAGLREQALVPCHVPVRDVGVPQRSANSGICWWGSMWFAAAFPPACAAVLAHHLRAQPALARGLTIADLRRPLHDAAASEPLRTRLYRDFAVGDDPAQAPELDGQNGFGQFTLLCSKLGVPLLTLMAPELVEVALPLTDARGASVAPPRAPRADEPGFLSVRTYHADFMPSLELVHAGRRWRLRSALVGSEFCGHQTALACCSADGRAWASYDSDAVRRRIGPVAFEVGAPGVPLATQTWWDALDRVLPVINNTSTSRYCDMNPRNRHPLESIARAYRTHAGVATAPMETSDASLNTVNMDWLYTPADASFSATC